MACSCADKWSTTILASQKGLSWKPATRDDGDLIAKYCESGGCGNSSIDKFAREELITGSDQRYSNTSMLIDSGGELVGFVSNAMGEIKMQPDELVERNMAHIDKVPVLFLHRLGVHKKHQGKKVSNMLVWRTFEILSHSCTHCAAAAVALMVDSDNERAKRLYASMGFERIELKNSARELHIIPYDAAIARIPSI